MKIRMVLDTLLLVSSILSTVWISYPSNMHDSMIYILILLIPVFVYSRILLWFNKNPKHEDDIINNIFNYDDLVVTLKGYLLLELTHILILIGRWY